MKIAVTRRIPDAGLEVLKAWGGAKDIAVHETDEGIERGALLRLVEGADAILSTVTEKMDAEAMHAAGPQLKIIANMAVGYDNISLADAAERKILVTNTWQQARRRERIIQLPIFLGNHVHHHAALS